MILEICKLYKNSSLIAACTSGKNCYTARSYVAINFEAGKSGQTYVCISPIFSNRLEYKLAIAETYIIIIWLYIV